MTYIVYFCNGEFFLSYFVLVLYFRLSKNVGFYNLKKYIYQFKIIFQLAISNEGDAAAVGLSIANTILGGATGGMSVLFINYKISGKWSYLQTLNGALAGKKSYFTKHCTVG